MKLGEIASSVEVLVTLIVLVIQVRGARLEFSSQITREIRRHNNEDIQLPLRDARTLEIHVNAQREFEGLSEQDKIYWGVWLYSYITQAEDAWLLNVRGVTGMEEMADAYIPGVASVLRSDGGQIMWRRLKPFFPDDFAIVIEKAITESDLTWLDMMSTDKAVG